MERVRFRGEKIVQHGYRVNGFLPFAFVLLLMLVLLLVSDAIGL